MPAAPAQGSVETRVAVGQGPHLVLTLLWEQNRASRWGPSSRQHRTMWGLALGGTVGLHHGQQLRDQGWSLLTGDGHLPLRGIWDE